jgi:hypothetical protein
VAGAAPARKARPLRVEVDEGAPCDLPERLRVVAVCSSNSGSGRLSSSLPRYPFAAEYLNADSMQENRSHSSADGKSAHIKSGGSGFETRSGVIPQAALVQCGHNPLVD